MNSIIKGLLFIGLGVLSFLWFAYEILGFMSTYGRPTEDNPVITLVLTALKLVMAIAFLIAGIKAFVTK